MTTTADPGTMDATAPAGTGPARSYAATCHTCIRKELDRLQAAHDAGTLEAHGDWSAGQILWHCGHIMRFSMEGFPFRPPLPVRLVGRFMKGFALGPRKTPRGIKLNRPGLDQLIPPGDTTFEQGMAEIREILDRVDEGGETYAHASPLFGPMTHDEWITLHAKHFAHHVEHLTYPGA